MTAERVDESGNTTEHHPVFPLSCLHPFGCVRTCHTGCEFSGHTGSRPPVQSGLAYLTLSLSHSCRWDLADGVDGDEGLRVFDIAKADSENTRYLAYGECKKGCKK